MAKPLFYCISQELKQDFGKVSLVRDGKEEMLFYDNIGCCFFEPVLPDFLTGYEFIRFYIDINKDKIDNLLSVEEYFDIIDFKREDGFKLIKDYFHGMKNKIQMLLLIISRPPVILLDEPLTSLDVVASLEIKNLLKRIKKDQFKKFNFILLKNKIVVALLSVLCITASYGLGTLGFIYDFRPMIESPIFLIMSIILAFLSFRGIQKI